MKLLPLILFAWICLPSATAFVAQSSTYPRKRFFNEAPSDACIHRAVNIQAKGKTNKIPKAGGDKISKKRRDQLGISDDEDEYDLGMALDRNTDPFITKVIAGSFILVLLALLVVGVIEPSLTDYGEGVCNPIRSAGKC